MARMAKVGSVPALLEFRAALAKYIQTCSTTLDESLGEIRRMENWLKSDQAAYWKKRQVMLTDKVAQLRQELSRKQQLDRVGPVQSRKSYVDEKQALDRARRLLEEAREKLRNTQKWAVTLEREGTIYRGMLNDLRDMLEVKLPTARTQLDNMVRALEAYAEVSGPDEEEPPITAILEEEEEEEETKTGADSGRKDRPG